MCVALQKSKLKWLTQMSESRHTTLQIFIPLLKKKGSKMSISVLKMMTRCHEISHTELIEKHGSSQAIRHALWRRNGMSADERENVSSSCNRPYHRPMRSGVPHRRSMKWSEIDSVKSQSPYLLAGSRAILSIFQKIVPIRDQEMHQELDWDVDVNMIHWVSFYNKLPFPGPFAELLA
jgi:hypothetical protein